MPFSDPVYTPGSCAMRLQNLEALSSASKSALLRSIANDISAVFICISKQLSHGTLSAKHTRPIHDFIKSIKKTELSGHVRLQRKVERHRQRERRWRAERKQVRKEIRDLMRHSEEICGRWKERLGKARGNINDATKELVVLRWKNELSKLQAERRMLLRGAADAIQAEPTQ
ncbi:hypothetical protein BDV29DRAFT_161470 [Aspergillus leporis]|jgi:hypothetical protein|uniref:Uncharacterized protein n=1 Tax=Aspergillus leporis TaxID=41062 RepID=A0A5N5WNW0_9EURO|nr:hypothetical protein BDV29DRAFT_161470 [Aspergillus leporis]